MLLNVELVNYKLGTYCIVAKINSPILAYIYLDSQRCGVYFQIILGV